MTRLTPTRRVRRSVSLTASVAAALALLLALPGAAVAQTDRYRATGAASGFAIEAPDVAEVAGGRSQIEIASDVLSHARGVGLLTVDTTISEIRIEEPNVARRDPESGENCAAPELPEPLDAVDVTCSFAEGETLDRLPSALSDGTGLGVALTGADAAALVDLLLGQIDEAGLTEAIRQAEAQLLDPVRTALADACLSAAGGTVGDGINEAGELIAEIKDQTGITQEITGETACDLLIGYTLDPPLLAGDEESTSADAVLTLARETLLAALQDASLLDLTLGGSTSEGDAATADVVGSSVSPGLDVALPSLDVLDDLLEALTGLTDAFLGGVVEDVQGVLDADVLGQLPSAGDLAGTVLGGLPADLLEVLQQEDPLLRITGGRSEATATYDRSASEVTTEGQVVPLSIDLADALVALLGLDETDPITVEEGDEVTVAEGTPLESTVRLATCSSEEATHNGLPGERISCDGLALILLKGLLGDDADTERPDGGLRVAAASTQAAAFGVLEPGRGEAPLPVTGGGAALAALALLGAVLTLRRRP